MQYVVQCYTKRIDRSVSHDDRNRETITAHTMMTCVNRDDAESMVRLLEHGDSGTLEDGPFQIERAYEVAAVFYLSKRTGHTKVTLSTGDLEMIASEYTAPRDTLHNRMRNTFEAARAAE